MFKNLVKFVLLSYLTLNYSVNAETKADLKKQTKLPPCKACKTFVESFKKGFTRTSKGKFEGGDTAWEEEKLGSYATSEVRLTEIQEQLCADVDEGQIQCYALLEEYDAVLEEWWFKKQTTEPDLYKYLCIDEFRQCCPEFHYGTNCTPCPGYPDNVCHRNGKCKGSGTRKGNGKCSCDAGYQGVECNECAHNYYESYKDAKKILCSKCHVSCEGNCDKAGPIGCKQCTNGWFWDETNGCMDVNECVAKKSPCTALQFCVNTDGSYKCLECDKSCNGCTGDGPDMCTKCAHGYILENNMCIDGAQETRKKYVFFTRYLTYLGLCIATCIIFNKNTILAAIIGIAVAIYISVSEYILNTPPTPKTDQLAEQIMQNIQ